jgi:predicted O-methyltransferase YrrM
MRLNLTKDFNQTIVNKISSNFLKNLTKQGQIDYNKGFGKEHYMFFCGISSQLEDNTKILEIGTHNGNSTIALSYGITQNKRIEIDTFDIKDILMPNCKKFIESEKLVNCHYENLFDNKTREEKKEFILSRDIIFIDIDPHEGILEKSMLEWLHKEEYKGIIIFDDIHLGLNHSANDYRATKERMSDFWKGVDNNIKYDLTSVGHSSGTGLVVFDKSKHDLIF